MQPNGTLWLLDRFGYAYLAHPTTTGDHTFVLDPSSAHYLGPGRPLGYHLDSSGGLVVCNSLVGLMRLDPGTRELRVLANRASVTSPLQPGSPIHYANDLDIASEGSIYFTDSTAIPPALTRGGSYDTMWSYLLTLFQGEPHGRLLVHRPVHGSTHVVLDRLWFANGVALAQDESFVLVAETPG